MFSSEKQDQLAILRHGVNLIYLRCVNQRIDESPPQVAEPIISSISQNLCDVDIFASDFRLPNTKLKSLFSDICIAPKVIRDPCFINPNPLKEDKIFFYDSPSEEAWIAQAAEAICQNYEKVKTDHAALLILLEKYGSSLPVTRKEDYDTVSLYEHLKLLCCLAAAGNDDKPFLLVSADFSGIQDFIYTISSQRCPEGPPSPLFFP